jgi:hypothetical protein
MNKNSGWPDGTPQEVIDEIEADLDAQTDEYKKWLRQSIGEVVGAALNNGAKMALNNYIDPRVFHAWEKGIK